WALSDGGGPPEGICCGGWVTGACVTGAWVTGGLVVRVVEGAAVVAVVEGAAVVVVLSGAAVSDGGGAFGSSISAPPRAAPRAPRGGSPLVAAPGGRACCACAWAAWAPPPANADARVGVGAPTASTRGGRRG